MIKVSEGTLHQMAAGLRYAKENLRCMCPLFDEFTKLDHGHIWGCHVPRVEGAINQSLEAYEKAIDTKMEKLTK